MLANYVDIFCVGFTSDSIIQLRNYLERACCRNERSKVLGVTKYIPRDVINFVAQNQVRIVLLNCLLASDLLSINQFKCIVNEIREKTTNSYLKIYCVADEASRAECLKYVDLVFATASWREELLAVILRDRDKKYPARLNGELKLNTARRELIYKYSKVPLSQIEHDLLFPLFLSDRPINATKYSNICSVKYANVAICRLRRKLDRCLGMKLIKSRYGEGYYIPFD